MTKLDLNRRNLIIAAGAGTLAACGMAAKNENRGDPTLLKPFGPFPSFGLEPNFATWGALEATYSSQGLPSFAPDYITLVRISGTKDWSLDVNHASFVNTYQDQAAREQFARTTLDLIAATTTRKKLRDLKLKDIYPRNYPAAQAGKPKIVDLESFAYLGTNHPVELYIWLDIPGVQLIDNRYLSFSPLSQKGQPYAEFDFPNANFKRQPISPNDSFFATKFNFNGGAVIQIRNYFCDYDFTNKAFKPRYGPGVPPSDPRAYGMNIHFAVMGPNGTHVPMSIDPDTGSGAGWEP